MANMMTRDANPRPGSSSGPTQSAAIQRGGKDASDVATECVDYRKMMADWQLVSDIMGGTKAMRQAGSRWLPQEPKEETAAYLVRLNRSTFFNAYKRAVQSLAGRPFLKPVTYAERLDDRIKEFILDADLNGRHMDMFLYDVFEKAMADGMRHVLVDKSMKPNDELTAADELRYGRRPYCVEIDPRNLTYWQYEYRFGYPFLTEIRIRETVTEAVGDWGQREVMQYRVLRPGQWEIWRKNGDTDMGMKVPGKEDWVLVEQGVNDLNYIPLVTIYTGRKGFMQSEPPLVDLAWENIHHWQSRSDQNHILHVARVPIWFGRGMETVTSEGQHKEYVISPNAMLTSSDPNADIKIVETNGNAIGAGAKDLEDCETRMAVLGTELLNKARGNALKTATEIDVDAAAQYGTLARMVRELEDAAEAIIEYMGDWEGVSMPDDEFVAINKEFGLAGHIELLAELRNARTQHDLSRYTYLQELKRHGALAPQVSVDDEMERIDAEGPDLGMMVPNDMQETDYEGAVPKSAAPTPGGPASSKNTPGSGRPAAAGERQSPSDKAGGQ